MTKQKLITILGPTASGKSALAVHMAKTLGSPIISGDAFQVYRGLNIGTAKITPEEAEGVPHYLIDILDPEEPYSAAIFADMAKKIIAEENEKGHIPILAGGTGLYIQGLLEGFEFRERVEGRKKWEDLYEKEGMDGLRAAILERDPNAEVPLDPQRSIRLLELLDNKKSQTAGRAKELVYDGPVLGIRMERARLYDRINERVDLMMKEGLADEVAGLLKSGVSPDAQSFKGIGYKEMVKALQGDMPISDAVTLIKKNTRHFAKRQITWYRHMPYITWIDRDKEGSGWIEKAMDLVHAYYKK
jgi:tRNA dimethylallyltransferase